MHSTFVNDGFGALLISLTLKNAADDILHPAALAEFNVKEIRPPRMDDSGRTKYPVLFRVYVVHPLYLSTH